MKRLFFLAALTTITASASAFALDTNPVPECGSEIVTRINGYLNTGFTDYQVSEILVADAYEGRGFSLCIMPKDNHRASATTFANCNVNQCNAKYKGHFASVPNKKPE